jgi:hypothetical protein
MREAFHLERFVTMVAYDPKVRRSAHPQWTITEPASQVAKNDSSPVFEAVRFQSHSQYYHSISATVEVEV